MKNYVITITRQFGSMGRAIGMQISKELGWKYLDREQIEKEAAEADESLNSLVRLNENGIKGYYKMAYPLGIGNVLKQDKMFEEQSKIICKYADSENCVIVGRCADYILRDKDNVLRCYIYAPEENRIINSISSLEINTKEFRPLIDEVDKARASYYKKYTGHDVNNLIYRDILINSASLGKDGTAKYLIDMAKFKFKLKWYFKKIIYIKKQWNH